MKMTLRNYIASIALFFAVGLALGLYLAHKQEPVTAQSGSVVVSAVTTTPLHPVSMRRSGGAKITCRDNTAVVPVMAENKQELIKEKVAPSSVDTPNQEVTAAAKVEDHSGSIAVVAVLNTDSGKSDIVFTRPTAEWLDKWSIAAGLSAGSLGYGFQGETQTVLFRIKDVYMDLRLDAWKWEGGSRRDDGHKFDGQAATLMRYNF